MRAQLFSFYPSGFDASEIFEERPGRAEAREWDYALIEDGRLLTGYRSTDANTWTTIDAGENPWGLIFVNETGRLNYADKPEYEKLRRLGK
jgi:hypothetical protein